MPNWFGHMGGYGYDPTSTGYGFGSSGSGYGFGPQWGPSNWGGWGYPHMGTPSFSAHMGGQSPFAGCSCPTYGVNGPSWQYGPAMTNWDYGYGQNPAFGYGYPQNFGFANPSFSSGWGLGGLRRWGGSYSPQYVSTGLPTDEEICEMVYDVIDADPFIPYDADIDVNVDAGVVEISGTVPNKHIKHSAGDDAWWVPGVVDVRNDLQVSGRRRVRSAPQEGAEGETATTGTTRRTSRATTR